MSVKIAPSILSADFGKLNTEVDAVEQYADILHIDVMDGNFVDNISFGAPVMKWIETPLPLHVHLMILNPEKYVEDFVKAGAERVVVHVEACGRGSAYDYQWGKEDNLKVVLEQIKGLGVECGVSIRPKTQVSEIEDVLEMLDEVLVMTVEPGFGGQKFMEDMVPKIVEMRDKGYENDIAIDGGVNAETGKICRDAGANVLIAGSYIFKNPDRKAAIESLRA